MNLKWLEIYLFNKTPCYQAINKVNLSGVDRLIGLFNYINKALVKIILNILNIFKDTINLTDNKS